MLKQCLFLCSEICPQVLFQIPNYCLFLDLEIARDILINKLLPMVRLGNLEGTSQIPKYCLFLDSEIPNYCLCLGHFQGNWMLFGFGNLLVTSYFEYQTIVFVWIRKFSGDIVNAKILPIFELRNVQGYLEYQHRAYLIRTNFRTENKQFLH